MPRKGQEQLPLFNGATRQHSRADAIAARDEGIDRAITHADAVEPLWRERAYSLLLAYTTLRKSFLVEEAREWAEDRGLPYPPDKRAWGAVILRAAEAGVVSADGYGLVRDPKSHRHPATLWRVNLT